MCLWCCFNECYSHCLQVKSLWWGAAVKQQEKRMWVAEVWGLSFLQWPAVSQVFIHPTQHPDVTCVFMSEKTDESTSAHFHRSLKLLNCFTEVQQKDQHPNKMFCLLLFFMFSQFSQGIQIQLLLSVMYPLVNAAFGHLYPGSLFNLCEVKKHIRTWQDVTRSKYTFTGSLRLIGEEHGLETVSVSDLFASFSTFGCRHFSKLFFFSPQKSS